MLATAVVFTGEPAAGGIDAAAMSTKALFWGVGVLEYLE
jgi:hypothetical protein